MCIRRYNFNTKLLKVEDEAKQFNVAISADLMDNKVDVIRKGLQVLNTEYIGRRVVLELLIIQALNSSTTLVRIDDKGYTAQELMTIYSYAVNEYYPRVKDIINDDTDYIDLYREYKPIYPIINLKYIRQEDIEKNK